MREIMTEGEKATRDYLDALAHKPRPLLDPDEFMRELTYRPDPNHPLSRGCTVIRQAGEPQPPLDLVGMREMPC